MKLSDMGRLVTLMTTVTLAFAGCGGQPQGQSTFPEGLTAVRQVNQHGKSGSGDLIYAAAMGKSYVLTYPQGKLVGTVSVGALDSCSDDAGNVFLAGDQIEELPMAERPPSPPSAPPVRLPDARSTPRPVISPSSSRGPAVTTLPYFQTRAVARRSMV